MTPNKLFGTDGIRAHSASSVLSPENIARLGRILGGLIHEGAFGHACALERPAVAIGRDTRASGHYIEHALVSGLASAGIDCNLLGVMPTSAVACNTKATESCLGVMISASHNPHYDNGLKIFDSRGFKISDAVEEIIEHRYFSFEASRHAVDANPGQITQREEATGTYSSLLKTATFDEQSKFRPKLVVDCALGAASSFAGPMFSEFGCDVSVIGKYQRGSKINLGFGSEAPDTIKAAVLENRADLGIAFDGDADRVIFIDEKGHSIDGDAILALIAIDLKEKNALKHDTLTATVMSTIALDHAVNPHGIKVVRTSVGDKSVAQRMLEEGFSFGGENSGHLIMFPYATTGDGILSALKFLGIFKNARKKASELMSFFKPTPKLLRNIAIAQKIPLNELPKTRDAINKINDDLKSLGRVLFRYSGTENKARLFVEAPTNKECERIADHINDAFSAEIKSLF